MKQSRAASSPPEVRIDPRGIRLSRPHPGRASAYEGILEFLISCDGSAPIPFGFEPASEQGVKGRHIFIGSFPDPSAGITCQVTLSPVPAIGGFAIEYEVENTGEDVSVRLDVRLHLPNQADPHWLIPGLFYGENRLAHSQRLYPGYSEIKRDPTGFWSNHWSFRSDRTSLPVVLCTNISGTAFIALDENSGQTSGDPLGMAMTSLALSSEDGQLSLSASLPAVEEPVRAASSSGDYAAVNGTMLLERGQPVNWQFEAGLVEKGGGERDKILRALYHDRWGRFPLKPKVSSIEAERLAIEGLCNWHLDPEHRVLREKALGERKETERRPFRLGERNGVFPAFVLLWYGRDNKEAAPVRVAHELLDSITQLVAPCGSFYEDFAGANVGNGGARAARDVHARPVAEAALFLVRAIRLEMQAHTAHPMWSSAVLSNLGFAVSAQRDDGAFPSVWNAETGEVTSWDGCDGLAWIAPLAAAGQVTGSREWLDAARRGALHYRSSVEEGFLTGTLEDHEGIPTCEAAHWALISYILLYEADHDPAWLDLARHAAEIALTWRMSYNIEFASASMLAQSSIATLGGDILSATQPLLGPWGLLSYGEMMRLSALTEDDIYEQRARESRLYASQLLARTDGEFNLRKGQTLGPISCTDGVIPKGLALKESLVWFNALVTYAALIERNQMISREALSGDAQSLAELALRASGVSIKTEIELPETAASRRSRESEVRRVPSTVRHVSPTAKTPRVPMEKLKEESTPVLPPAADTLPKSTPPTRPSSTGVVRMPAFPKEIHEPRRSTHDSAITDERPAPIPLTKPAAELLQQIASSPDESDVPPSAPAARIPGAPVGKDPVTNQNVFISSPVMAATMRREAEERLKEREQARVPSKPVIPVHRGYRAPVADDPPARVGTPPPEHQSHDSVPEKLWVERPAELPKWHVYQYGLDHVKPLPEEGEPVPLVPRSGSSAEISGIEASDSEEKRPKKRVPFEQRHSPLPKDDSQAPPVVPREERPARPTTAPVRASESSVYRLPTGLEDNTPESREGESPADPSKIKWKIF